jgi:hypothetical protein
MQKQIPAELHSFLLRLPSIPHLEAIILFYRSPNELWKGESLATRLYIPQRTALRIMSDLRELGICSPLKSDSDEFVYRPESERLNTVISSLVDYYAKNLIEVTHLIHARTNTQEKAQEFANAFIWRKDK